MNDVYSEEPAYVGLYTLGIFPNTFWIKLGFFNSYGLKTGIPVKNIHSSLMSKRFYRKLLQLFE